MLLICYILSNYLIGLKEAMTRTQIKDVKRILRNELKRKYPKFKPLKRKKKKHLLSELLRNIVDNYAEGNPVETSGYELCGVDQIPDNIYTLEQIEKLLNEHQSGVLPFKIRHKTTAIKDPELLFINQFCHWSFVNRLIEPENYSHHHRDKYPVHLFKAELLRSLKYPEISYRKFCNREINNKERKENRAFIGLKGKQKIHHFQLSKFRSELSYDRQLNVMVYFIYLFLKAKNLSKNLVYAVDSTELAEKINSYPLVELKVGKEKIRLYQDIDADCGPRRKKRDKSTFVVGYRLHTLTVIDVEKQTAYPLFSILASANHHDNNFLSMLVELGKAIGLELNIVIGDQAYGDEDENEAIQKKNNVTILTQPKTIKILPDFVDAKSFEVHMNDICEIPMNWCGKTDTAQHEYYCGSDEPGACALEGSCSKTRNIPVDSGAFGQIPYHIHHTQKLCKMRKVAERPFNLLKHREGLEPLRTLSRETTRTVTAIANIATLLIEIAGFRRTPKVSKNKQLQQLQLFKKAA